MEEDFYDYECYNEWANDELIWGRGMFNWRRANAEEEPAPEKKDDFDYDIEIPF